MNSLIARKLGPVIAFSTLLLAAGSAYSGGAGPVEKSTVGVFNPATDTFFLTNSNAAGPASIIVSFGPADSTPTVGDFDADGSDSIGVYSPSLGRFLLNNSNVEGTAAINYRFGPSSSSLIGLVGNWNGLSEDTGGLYDPVGGTFFLRNSNTTGAADIVTSFGPNNSTMTPLSGNWTGTGSADGIGLYDPATGVFFLRNDATTSGNADFAFRFGPGGAGFVPVVGDWDDDGIDTIGIYNPTTSTFFLRNTNSAGAADKAFSFAAPGSLVPVSGNYDGN